MCLPVIKGVGSSEDQRFVEPLNPDKQAFVATLQIVCRDESLEEVRCDLDYVPIVTQRLLVSLSERSGGQSSHNRLRHGENVQFLSQKREGLVRMQGRSDTLSDDVGTER